MEFDVRKTVELVKGGLLAPEPTWNTYLAATPAWQKTLALLTGPLLLANIILSVLFTWMMGGFSAYLLGGSLLMAWVYSLVAAAAGFTLLVFIINFLAGTFGGQPNFDRAFAAVSLSAIPACLGGIAGALIPWLGFLVSLAGGIWSLVLLYRIVPLALGVPGEKRTLHFVATLVVTLVANMIVAGILTVIGLRPDVDSGYGSRSGKPVEISSGGGMLAEAQRQAALMQAAGEDEFEPPANGKVSKQQVRELVSVIEKSRAAMAEQAAQVKKAEAELQGKETKSTADLIAMYRTMGKVVSMNNIEMEVLKSGGGNWAEHTWVKGQLRTARLQQGTGSDAIEHNYALYKANEAVLADAI
ncbi:YIP1 family protein [Haliea sp. E17]|uniref:YIP1 family protein n=1 Tax=Haliea sp. E17 TaxID=3401576 RepID=UPI003AAD7683